jgi:hypothetical protein
MAIPRAVVERNGFVSNVYSNAEYKNKALWIHGVHTKLVTGDCLRLCASNKRFQASILESQIMGDRTVVRLSESLDNALYFCFGTWGNLKTVDTNVVIATLLNAVKGLQQRLDSTEQRLNIDIK